MAEGVTVCATLAVLALATESAGLSITGIIAAVFVGATLPVVGARVALNVLSSLSTRELERALALGDKAGIGRAQGVGPKLATRPHHEHSCDGRSRSRPPPRVCSLQLQERHGSISKHSPRSSWLSAILPSGRAEQNTS